jgi:hypothetical protein
MKAFECKKCGECCYGEGGIRVRRGEIERIARFLKMEPDRFLTQYCEIRNGRRYVTTGPGGFCVFYDKDKACLIHPVKPRPCTLWPFYPALLADEGTWKYAQEACPGINPDCTHEEFVRQARETCKDKD